MNDPRSLLSGPEGGNLVSRLSLSQVRSPSSSLITLHSYLIDRLPEGGVGMHGYDDGEGDD